MPLTRLQLNLDNCWKALQGRGEGNRSAKLTDNSEAALITDKRENPRVLPTLDDWKYKRRKTKPSTTTQKATRGLLLPFSSLQNHRHNSGSSI